MAKEKPYIIVTHLPACSAVLYVNGKEVTILREDTKMYCEAFADGFVWASGLKAVKRYAPVTLPAGNPALSYAKKYL